MRSRFPGVVLGAFLLMAIPALAHHGAASFDAQKQITVKGTVTEWVWANPHCFLKFDAKDDTGTVRSWTVETGNPSDISRQGFRRTSFKAGAEITVTLQPVKTGEPVGRLRTAVLADGSTLSTAPGAGAAGASQPGSAN